MPLPSKKVNVTFAVTKEESKKLVELMKYFDKYSIKPVHRTDVLRHLINSYHELLKSGKMEEALEAIEEVLKNDK